MKCYNAFGIKPTNSFTSAGSDYYIPNLTTQTQIEKAYKAFEKSYNKTTEEIGILIKKFEAVIDDKHHSNLQHQIPNLVHLFLALYDPIIEEIKRQSIILAIHTFMDEFVIYDEENDKVGLKMRLNDTLFINSGIKVALDTVLSDKNDQDVVSLLRKLDIGVAGLYVNKSGKGNAGWDVRACLVDEDYAGFVHLSQSYTKELIEDGQNIIYCGDKLTQMMLIPVFHDEYVDTDEDNYNKIMANSQRGDKGFGSQDIKH